MPALIRTLPREELIGEELKKENLSRSKSDSLAFGLKESLFANRLDWLRINALTANADSQTRFTLVSQS